MDHKYQESISVSSNSGTTNAYSKGWKIIASEKVRYINSCRFSELRRTVNIFCRQKNM